jgi:BON domain
MRMGEYEDRYPDAFGRGEEIEPASTHRHFFGRGLPRQVSDDEPAVIDAPQNPEQPAEATAAPAPRPAEPTRPAFVERPPPEISADVYEQLNASPFIDASGISISVDGSEVRLDGTINSLIAIAMAKALASNVPGVSRVEVRLRVQTAPRNQARVPGAGAA